MGAVLFASQQFFECVARKTILKVNKWFELPKVLLSFEKLPPFIYNVFLNLSA
jgi:hypothetical protein